MRQKLIDGNSHSIWLGRLIKRCDALGIWYWVENPDGSFIWIQPEWQKLEAWNKKRFFKTDFCRRGTPWRKRTRFLTNTALRGTARLCAGNHRHIVLRGRSKKHGIAWTKVAEPYPRGLCRLLARAVCSHALDLDMVAFCGHRRIGEAKNPGPRRRFPQAKDPLQLDGVQLIRPETVALGKMHWDKFLNWLGSNLDEATISSLWVIPGLMGSMMAAYGRFWYGEGGALYAFRHMVVYGQRSYPSLKGSLQEAWVIIAKWEEPEPVQHRKPIPFLVIQAMSSLCLQWKWFRTLAVILITFHGCMRPGEVLTATRRDLVLPVDLDDETSCKCFLRISKPKPGRRGMGRSQHATINDPVVSSFLTMVFRDLRGTQALYPGSSAAFRTRWNALLRSLRIPTAFGLTPGSLRAGGTVYLYRLGYPIMDILWLLRLKNLETLQHYLQEISTEVTMVDLPSGSWMLIRNLAAISSALFSTFQL
eukprot:Skav231382  [mRNA]  locus=scaffold1586:905940:907367:- [translate_table: standard]